LYNQFNSKPKGGPTIYYDPSEEVLLAVIFPGSFYSRSADVWRSNDRLDWHLPCVGRCRTGAFAPRIVILLGEQSRLPNSRTTLEMQRCGYSPVQSFEIRPEELATTEILPSLRGTIDGAIVAARAGSVTEILLLVGWEHSRIIESITKMLGILPIPIYLLPDEN
jgi:hypothetical protein